MRVPIVRIGNSRGIRIPKPILEEAGVDDEVELTLVDGRIVLLPILGIRTGWGEAIDASPAQPDDTPRLPHLPTRFDEEEWEW